MKKKPELMAEEMHKFVYGYNPPEGSKDKPIAGLIAKGMDEERALKLADIIKQFAMYAFERHDTVVF